VIAFWKNVVFCSLLAISFSSHGVAQSMEARVKSLVGKLEAQESQDQALADLEALGEDAIRFLVPYVASEKRIAKQQIKFENRSQSSFEKFRWYTPETVGDAIAALLNQLTGQHFGDVYNGASREVREQAAHGWEKWCKARYPKNK
jgi:hypothetical protein